MKSMLLLNRMIFVVLSFAVLVLSGCGSDDDSTPSVSFTSGQVSGKTFAYTTSTDSTGIFTFNNDNTWDINIDELDLSGNWSINTAGELVCVTTDGGDFTLTYTLISTTENTFDTDVEQVNPADPTNPSYYTATLTAVFSYGHFLGKTFDYASSTGTAGTFAFNTDNTWNINIDDLDLSGNWSINQGKLVCITTDGGDFTLTYTALVSDDANNLHASVVQVDPSDPDNPENYTATLTPVFTSDLFSGKTFEYASSTGTMGTFTFNADNTWDINLDELALSGDWSIEEGKLVCVTTYGGDFTLTYTALVSNDTNAIHASVVQVNPADTANPYSYSATLTAINTISGKIDPMYGIYDVTMALDGDQTLTVATDAYGNYSFTVPNGEYRITPTKTNRLFTPLDAVLNVNNASVSDVDFMPAPFMSGTATNVWKVTGSMTYGRADHRATLLQNGNVLVAGGFMGFGKRASTEFYDPETGKWSTTGFMTYKRSTHAMTLLKDGRVLVSGGEINGDFVSDSAEFYDPSTGKWSTTGFMVDKRTKHSMTLLKDGRVLVVGGKGPDNAAKTQGYPYASAELYAPETGKWSTTGSLDYAVYSHTAVLLDNGKVLVVGGKNKDGCFANASLYEPETGKWKPTGFMAYERQLHAMTLLKDGRVLVAGGLSTNVNARASAEIYDPMTGKWTTTGFMNYQRFDHTMTLLADGRVLVAGGRSTNGNQRASAEIYDPVTGKWTTTGFMNYERTAQTMTLLADERVLVVGGEKNIFTSFASTEIFKPGSN